MANCTASEVRLIIKTNMNNTDIGSLITLADAEITARDLNTRTSNLKKLISMYLTADLIASRDPTSVTMGPATTQSPSPQSWRQKAELLILKSGEPPIILKNDPLPNE